MLAKGNVARLHGAGATQPSIAPSRNVRKSHRSPVGVSAGLKLYTNPGSRGKMAEWCLQELGVQYEEVLLNMRAGEHKTPEFRAINPFAKVPALLDGEQPIFESGAIVIHIANKYGKLTPDQVGQVAQWTLFANSTFSEAFFVKGPTQNAPVLMGVLNDLLGKNKFLTGDNFSPADVPVAGYLLYLPMFFPDFQIAKPFPNVWRYMQDCANVPSCPESYRSAMQEALAKEGSGNILQKIFK